MIEQMAPRLSSDLAKLVNIKPLTCIETANQYLGPVLVSELISWNSDEFVNNMFEMRNLTMEIFDNVKQELVTMVSLAAGDKSMDKLAKIVKSKVNQVNIIAGFDNKLIRRDEPFMDKWYADLELNPSEYFKNLLKIRKNNNLKEFTLKFDSEFSLYGYATIMGNPNHVGAMYLPDMNALHLSLGLLTSNYFLGRHWSLEQNYAILGSILGHELSHSIDTNGILFDEFGDFSANGLDIINSCSKYKSTLDCIHDQYDGRSVAGTSTKLNGTRTINENFSDILGYQLSYRAIKRLVGKSDFDRKSFWTWAASVWCDDPTLKPRDIAMQSEHDPHSPAEFRVNLAIPNSDQFQETFQCGSDAKMIQNKKCKLWT